MTTTETTFDPAFLAAFRAGTLTADHVEAALSSDRSAIVFLFLQRSLTLAAGTTPGG